MSRSVAGAVVAAAAALACAQPGSPPGGGIDRSPPRVVGTTPAAFDTITDLKAPVVIRFDERISERLQNVSEFRQAVLVSPATSPVEVKRHRQSLEIRLKGGWEPDQVYRVVVLPVFRDLFGNQRKEPIDLVFSTGAAITETALAGFVADRITGKPVADVRVEATRRIDGKTYVAATDTGGFFAMRFIPAGAYDVAAWVDQNRDLTPDFFEVQDTGMAALGIDDTMVVEMALLPMDTTPARLARVEVIDSAKLRLTFDDYFAPGPVAGRARLFLLPDTTLVTEDGRLVHSTKLDSILAVEAAEAAARDSVRREAETRARLQAIQDSLAVVRDSLLAAGDTAAADTVGRALNQPATPDTAAGQEAARPPAAGAQQARRAGQAAPPERGAPPGGQRRGPPGQAGRQQPRAGAARQGNAPETRPLPAQTLVLLLPGTLTPDTTYYVVVDGVVNIRGVPGGGGAASFRTPPAPADTAVADSAAVEAPDSTGAPPDTIPPVPDTVPPPDTIPSPDTIPPDTIPPDSVPRLARPSGPGGLL